ncbi:spermatogenesis-associated protein 31D1-like [Thomomys bottae]
MEISQFSWWQAHNKNTFLPRLPHCDFQQENVSFHPPDSYFWRHSNASHVENRHIPFLDLNIQELLKRQKKKKTIFETLEKAGKEDDRPVFEQKWSEKQLTSSWNSMHSLVGEQDTIAPQTDWDMKGKTEHLGIHQQLLYMKTMGKNLEQKDSQLFWGLPSLHSESIVATFLVSREGGSIEPHLILFNEICKDPVAQMQGRRPPPLPQSIPLPLANVHTQPMTQSQTLPFTRTHFHTCVNPPLLTIPLYSPPCGNTSHSPQNRNNPVTLHGNQYLECHMVQKHQDSSWGSVPEVQNRQESICPLASNVKCVRQTPQSYVPVSAFSGHFCEPQNLQLHVPNRLIPPWCFQAYLSPGSLVLMEPQCNSTQIAHHNCNPVSLQPFEYHGHICNDQRKSQVSQLGTFYESVATSSQLRRDTAQNLGHILGKYPLNNLPMDSEYDVLNCPTAAPERQNKWVYNSRNSSGNTLLRLPRNNLNELQIRSILRLHVIRKFWQISVGQIPLMVCRSWLVGDNMVPHSGSSHTHMEKTNLLPLLSRSFCSVTTLELPFLDQKTQQMLEAHIIRFQMSQRWGLPLKVLESIKFYMLREAKTWPLPQFDFLSTSRHLARSATSFQEDVVGTTNSIPILYHSLSANLHVDQKGHGLLTRLPSNIEHELVDQTFLLCTHNTVEKVNLNKSELESRYSPGQFTKQDVAGPNPRDERVSFSHTEKMLQDKSMGEISEHFPTSDIDRVNEKKTVLANRYSPKCRRQNGDEHTSEDGNSHHRRGVLQKQNMVHENLEHFTKPNQLGSTQMTNTHLSKVETTLTTEYDPISLSILKDPTLKFKLNTGSHNQDESSSSDMSFPSGSLTSESSLSYDNSISSGDVEAFQELHTYLDGIRRNTEQWDTGKHAKFQGKCYTLPERRLISPESKKEEFIREDSGLEISTATSKSHDDQERKAENPSESNFRKKISQFFQWIHFRKKSTGEERSEKDKALFMSCGPPEAHELMETLGKLLEKKLACRQAPQDMGMSQEKELQDWTKLNKEQPSTSDSQQEAISPRPSYCSTVGWVYENNRPPQKITAFREQL